MSARPRLFMLQTTFFMTAVVVLASIPSARAQQAFFMGLGDLPGGTFSSFPTDISADGSVVVGGSNNVNGNGNASAVFRWTRDTGMVSLGADTSYATSISYDGSTIVGFATSNDLWFRWREDTGTVFLPGYSATAVNGDGSVVVFSDGRRWKSSGGFDGPFPPLNSLHGVSSDATAMVGWDPGGNGYLWTQLEGVTDLGAIFNNPSSISADGKVVIGHASSPNRAVRWTNETGVVFLDPLPGGAVPITASNVSADGSIVVGGATGGADPGAFIWDGVHGTRNLQQLLVREYGLGNSLAGWSLRGGTAAVSGDGRTIVGAGTDPEGHLQQAWIAYLGTPVPEPSTLLLAALALTPLAWRLRGVRKRRPRG